MNIETLKAEILNCQEAENAFKTDLTKGKRYLLTEVFYPFYREPEEAETSNLDFSAFTKEELFYVYDEIEELTPLFPALGYYMTTAEHIRKTPSCVSKAVYI